MSAKGLFGRRVEAMRAGIITIGASSAIRAAETASADIFKDSLRERRFQAL
jgi:hypothetical protein